jgi:hypothetical protein
MPNIPAQVILLSYFTQLDLSSLCSQVLVLEYVSKDKSWREQQLTFANFTEG